MLILTVGVNHRTAPVMVRERLAFGESSINDALRQLNGYPSILGCVIVSTCNRTEIYATVDEMDEGLIAIRTFLSQRSGITVSEISDFTYSHNLYDAARHLFRVASGLDSMLLGETEILGQVREAYRQACENNTTNRIINTLFQQAIAIGKRVRRETGIDRNAASISYAAVELAKNRLGRLSGCTALIIGAGHMSELAMKNLAASGVNSIIIANRSFRRAAELAEQFACRAVNFYDFGEHLIDADIVISSTAAPHYVLKTADVSDIIIRRAGKPVVMIDLAVPRDIEGAIGELPGVALYDIDALETVVDRHMAERWQAAQKGEAIIEEELGAFIQWLGSQFVIPTITALVEQGEEIKTRELKRALNRLSGLSEHDRKVVATLANSIVNQMLHTPITQLKSYARTNEGHLYTKMVQNIFCLEIEPQREDGG